LLEERSVTRAAKRLNLSQPAVSAALARLRGHFGDALLIAQGRRMVPSAGALAMRTELKVILASINELVVRSANFDPATSQRTFRICASDYLVAVLFPKLVPDLAQQGPAVGLDIVPPSEEARTALDRGELDLLLTPQEHCVPGHPTHLLFEEHHVVAGWNGNPALAEPLTQDVFFAAGHIAVRVGEVNRASFAESKLDALPCKRRTEITASSFTTVPDLLVGTNRLAVMHERLARVMAERMPIAWQRLPFGFPPMREMIQLNRTRAQDRGLAWLIERLKGAAFERPDGWTARGMGAPLPT
jgi:DNA-binding transcriptional LysR family regulator